MDEVEIEAFFRGRLGGTIRDVVPIGAGDWSRAYAFRRDGADLVARFSATNEDFEKDRFAARFASIALPIPRILEIGSASGEYFAISERAEGNSLDLLTEGGMRAALPSLLASLDATREADLVGTSGFGRWDGNGRAPFRSWRDFLLDVKHEPAPGGRTAGWRARLESSPSGARLFDEAYELLHALTGGLPDGRYLAHADLLNGNVLVADDRVSAFLDWGVAMYGDFLYDIAWLCFWAPLYYHAWDGIDFAQEAATHYAAIGLEVPALEERLRVCEVHIGLDGVAYSAFKERWDEIEPRGERTLAIAMGR